jgi:hypothetical protein
VGLRRQSELHYGSPDNIALSEQVKLISPPDARLQSVKWQVAMKVGAVSNPYVT